MRSSLLLAAASVVLVACGGATAGDSSATPDLASGEGTSSGGNGSTASGDRCEPAANELACGWDDARLRSCAKIESGIYGVAITTYVNYRGPDPGLMCNAAMTITATPRAGGPVQRTQPKNGKYTLALDAGVYEICASQPDAATTGPYAPCTSIEIGPGQVRRVDAGESRSVGGIYLSLSQK